MTTLILALLLAADPTISVGPAPVSLSGSRATLAGNGPGRTILRAADGLAFAVEASAATDCEIRDLTIAGSGGPNAVFDGLRLGEGVERLTVRNVEFIGIKGFAVRLGRSTRTRGVRLIDCTFRDCGMSPVLGVVPDLEIRDCRFERCGRNNGDHAIYLSPSGGQSVGPVRIEGCTFDGPFATVQTRAADEGDAVSEVRDLAVVNNLFRRPTFTGPPSYLAASGLMVRGNVFLEHSLGLVGGRDILVSANRWEITSDSDHAVDCLQTGNALERLTVVDNHFRGGRFGLAIGGAAAKDILVRGNTFSGQETALWARQAAGTGTIENVLVESNRIDAKQAVNFYTGYRPAGFQVFRGNLITGGRGGTLYSPVPYEWVSEGNLFGPGQRELLIRP